MVRRWGVCCLEEYVRLWCVCFVPCCTYRVAATEGGGGLEVDAAESL